MWKYYLYFSIIFLTVFVGQSVIFFTVSLPEYLEPLKGNETVLNYVSESLRGVWLDMLLWPVLLFTVLGVSVIGLLKNEGK